MPQPVGMFGVLREGRVEGERERGWEGEGGREERGGG